nr:PREDICTED: bifunctional methylenetetrahydrofolate dehydrogenase/cyclohydrolase, mitochondrial-like [Paralichthys olivaceus]
MAASVSPLRSSFRICSPLTLHHPRCRAKLRTHRKYESQRRHVHQTTSRHAAVVISGTELARQLHREIQRDVEELVAQGNMRPHLGVVLVGDDPASRTYVRNKTRAASILGISSDTVVRPSSVSQEELLELIDKMNRDWRVSGLLVQLPLPDYPQYEIESTHIVSPTLLKTSTPKAKDFSRGDATVTIVHRCTPRERLKELTNLADIVIAAAGVPRLITADMVKEGAAVIDVGINRIQDPKTGKLRLIGDVDFEGVKEKAGIITPVPGGVGPMTVAMLMKNTVTAARNALMH